jgi:hypothetical protein
METNYGDIKSAPIDRDTSGPFDLEEVVGIRPMIDFGAIQVPAREDLVLKLEVEETGNRIVALTIEFAGSALQLQAFSAPASDGLWHSIRGQLMESISSQGGRTEEVIGPLGPELNAEIPLPDGQNRLAKFIGVDGPRWFLRGVISGTALTNSVAMLEAIELFRSLVVARGLLPLPPRDLLVLSAPAGAKKVSK